MGNFTGKEGVEGDQKVQPGNYGIDQGSRTGRQADRPSVTRPRGARRRTPTDRPPPCLNREEGDGRTLPTADAAPPHAP